MKQFFEHPIFRLAARQSFGVADIALGSSFFAIGALLGESGLDLWQAAVFSVFTYALPGQPVAAELLADGAGIVAIAIAVAFVNARLLPMCISILPLLRPLTARGWRDFALAHLVAVASWVCFMASYRSVDVAWRWRHFTVTAVLLWGVVVLMTMAGHRVGAMLSAEFLAALLFLNPSYFLCIMLFSLVRRCDAMAMLFAAALLPPLHHFSPQWDIIIVGLIGGGAAFMLFSKEAPST